MPPIASRTIGPLHLEDLEPHRFEDLVRQLVYDFRPWSSLEPTGRGGSDDGFDARGWERTAPTETLTTPADDDIDLVVSSGDRLWLIQCKREKAIAPKKLSDYLDALPQSKEEPIYGIIFAAACDFSKMARDAFRTKTREMGFSEAYLWGKADIEDQLFQPKNDHLLFAYCGISLQMRKRTLKTEVRARLATKRKAQKVLVSFKPVVIRDATDERYPWLDEDDKLPREKRGRWLVVEIEGCKSSGIHVRHSRQFAVIREDGTWDYAEKMNDAVPDDQFDFWSEDAEVDDLRVARRDANEVWMAQPEADRAWLEVFLVLPYEAVLDFDESGDEYHSRGAHIYTSQWLNGDPPYRPYVNWRFQTISQYSPRTADPDDDEKRIKLFARREAKPEKANAPDVAPEPGS